MSKFSCVHGWKPSQCPVSAECRKPEPTEDELIYAALRPAAQEEAGK